MGIFESFVNHVDMTTVLISLVAFLTSYWLLQLYRRPRFPPGPMSWPLIGNMPQIFGKALHLALTNLGDKYGPLVWLNMGGENVLVVNTIDSAITSFVRQGRVFAGRPKRRKTVQVLLGQGKDIVMSDAGPELKFHRKLVHSFLSSQTRAGQHRMEDMIMFETESLSDKLALVCKGGQSFDPKLDISRVVANVLCMCILDRRFDDVDDAFLNQLHIIQDIVDNIESFNIVDVFPFLERFPIPSWRRFLGSLKRRDEWLTQVISEHRETLGENNRDLLDILLKEQEQAKKEGDKERLALLSDVSIGHIVYELFGGGIESTTMTILWFIIYMIRNPEWQKRIYDEIHSVTDSDTLPRPFDRSRYPVLEATIKETLRMASVLPVGFPHRTMEDTKLSGLYVPKDTMVLMNIWAIHHDKQAWHDPYTFNPGRFLDECPGERYSYLPFGIGNRVCLGSTISKMEIFMYCACLLSRYELVCPQGDPLPDVTGIPGLTLRPKPFRIKLIER
ncbi:steroid 17-alpha-hydroxylase/17,20 lyase-like [Ylistrum balloti]|uniref:steroid 17-alpha-hydroxylase/17,20 lyase-like n=1 Tax=Ylistrum balloti TaxID=509963 RepID=UPI00290588A1|nr:steroid 17-alpha-hydroxylase/17,20 lyase-like [Ylistrum balloti]